ncbi:fructokinase [Collibacillus ludicampi]|uniref:Fructokinase n=1 Tax=Collibacillus ludicampi TaxID=2771369 RepID=A0AAV4LBY9_9BACL|nr:carbohydrate kinase [Collibacillus ludicampi]GIM45163.1 fructokinase [Collibacillus ludicampi]
MIDVISFGDMVVDFLPERAGRIRGITNFAKASGGAPANVAVAVSRLGGRSSFIGKVGEDEFGYFLRHVLEKEGVDTSGLIHTHDHPTGVAFVQRTESGERSFLFYREKTADMSLSCSDIDESLLGTSVIFHFGSNTLIHPDARAATIRAATIARERGSILSFDVNMRFPLWPSEQACIEQIRLAIPYAHVLKVSFKEMEWLTHTTDLSKGTACLLEMGPDLILVTRGEKGTYYRTRELSGNVPAYNVNVVDTTGAGDGFVGGFLRQLTDHVEGRSFEQAIGFEEELREMIRYANAVGALTTTRMGAVPALPTKEEVFEFQYRNRTRKIKADG